MFDGMNFQQVIVVLEYVIVINNFTNITVNYSMLIINSNQ